MALSRRAIYIHGCLGLPLAVIGYPLSIWVPPHYAGSLGLDLAMVGTIIMLARFTDVATDPLLGELSDRWQTRFGRRKPWILIGMPVMMYGIYKLFIPGPDVGLGYFLLWLTLFFVGSTLISLPHRAWGAELSTDYHERSRVTASREFYVLTGLLVAALVPLVVEIRADGGAGVGEVFAQIYNDAIGAFTGEIANKVVVDRKTLTGPVLAALAFVIMCLLPIAVFLVLTFVKEPKVVQVRRVSLRDGFSQLARNGPMLRVLLIALLVHFGESFRNAVSLFFVRDIVGIPTIGAAYAFYFIAGLAAIPFWLWLGRKIGKHRAFIFTLITVACVSAANLLLEHGDYFAFFCLFIVKGFCFGGLQFLPISMIADVIDIDSARTGGQRAGSYFAVLGLTEKLAIAIGTGLSLNVVGLMGFSAGGGVAGSSEMGVLALRLVYCLGPVFFYGLAFRLIWNYPLTPVRQQRLRSMIERRNARLSGAA